MGFFFRDKFQVNSKSEGEADIYRETEMLTVKQIEQELHCKKVENRYSGQQISINSKVSRLDPFFKVPNYTWTSTF